MFKTDPLYLLHRVPVSGVTCTSYLRNVTYRSNLGIHFIIFRVFVSSVITHVCYQMNKVFFSSKPIDAQ